MNPNLDGWKTFDITAATELSGNPTGTRTTIVTLAYFPLDAVLYSIQEDVHTSEYYVEIVGPPLVISVRRDWMDDKALSEASILADFIEHMMDELKRDFFRDLERGYHVNAEGNKVWITGVARVPAKFFLKNSIQAAVRKNRRPRFI